MTTHAKTTSTYDSVTRWCRTIWSCEAKRGVLLYRHYLIDTKYLGIYLHHLMASDEDRALHDHPWSFVTILLTSGYWEWIPWDLDRGLVAPVDRRLWRPRFSILRRPARYKHRLELAKPCWTLVFRGPRQREWGFWTARGWLDWKTYGRMFCD